MNVMKKIGLIVVVVIGLGWWGWYKFWPVNNPSGLKKSELPTNGIDYRGYSFDNLKKRYIGVGSTIEIGGNIEEVELRRQNLGYKVDFDTKVISFTSGGKKMSGMINYRPWESKKSPIVIMVRGYAEKVGYYPGYGTWRVADELAKNGYMTISLDFLGYGKSDMESLDVLEARFEKVENVLDLLASVKQLPFVDKNKISFWAHSNGGQIVLSVLEVDGGKYPTVLWAPMTNPFPQSVLETIDEDSPVKWEIDNFLKSYDSREYAFENYYAWINSPILIIQGNKDPWCEVEWQEKVVNSLKELNKKAELKIIEGAGHNMEGEGKWTEAVELTKEWFM